MHRIFDKDGAAISQRKKKRHDAQQDQKQDEIRPTQYAAPEEDFMESTHVIDDFRQRKDIKTKTKAHVQKFL